MPSKTLLYHQPIPLHTALRLLNPLRVSFHKFGDSALLFLVQNPSGQTDELSLPTVVDTVVQDCVETLQHQFARVERETLRSRRTHQKKKGNWSLVKRRAPFYHTIYDQARRTTVKEYYELALAIVRDHPLPWSPKSQGRPFKYDRYKLLATILIKHVGSWSYRTLVNRLAEAEIELRKAPQGLPEYPHYSYLAKLCQALPEAYLAQLVGHLEFKVYELYCQKFGGSTDHWFSADSTEDPCTQYQIQERAMKQILRRETMTYTLTCRLPTNTIVAVEFAEIGVKSRCDIRTSLDQLPKGSTMLADREYDVEYNHQRAVEREVAFHCPAKQYQGKPYRGWYRGQNRGQFEPTTYRWRKLGERPFGNFVARGVALNRYKTKHTRRQGLLLNAFAHNLLAYFMELWWHRSFLLLPGVS